LSKAELWPLERAPPTAIWHQFAGVPNFAHRLRSAEYAEVRRISGISYCTVRVTVVVALTPPEEPVIVIVYCFFGVFLPIAIFSVVDCPLAESETETGFSVKVAVL
jgi:hypothetical protein